MHVRMADQGLPPRVEDAQHADLRAEMARVGGDLAERRRARLKEPGVQTGAVPIGQRQEPMRQREDDVHIRHVEQIPLARVEPALPRLRLALRAVPISTRVIGDGLMPAGVTPIEMPAERGGATARDRSQHGSLLRAQPRMLLDEGVTLRVEDIGHLHGRPAHDVPSVSASAATAGGPRARARAAAPADWAPPANALREMEIHRRVREVGVAQQHLDGAQVRAGLEQVRRVRMAQRVRTDATIDAGRLRGEAHRVPDDLGRERLVGTPAVPGPGRGTSAAASSGSTRGAP